MKTVERILIEKMEMNDNPLLIGNVEFNLLTTFTLGGYKFKVTRIEDKVGNEVIGLIVTNPSDYMLLDNDGRFIIYFDDRVFCDLFINNLEIMNDLNEIREEILKNS